MVKGKWFPQGADLSVPLSIRQQVFSKGRDALDDMAQWVVVYREEEPVGAARLWWADGAFYLGEVGVLPAERGNGYGDLLVRLLLFKALSHSASLVQLTAPPSVAPFFARYGFTAEHPPAEGETSIPMSIRAEDISLSHCAGE